LSRAERHTPGGETVILQPHVLHGFWSSFASGKGQELRDLVQLVPSPFGQLTVFDPRSPHGVRAVHGTRDPQQVRARVGLWHRSVRRGAMTQCVHAHKMAPARAVCVCVSPLAVHDRTQRHCLR
jgi:hypothetical protein